MDRGVTGTGDVSCTTTTTTTTTNGTTVMVNSSSTTSSSSTFSFGGGNSSEASGVVGWVSRFLPHHHPAASSTMSHSSPSSSRPVVVADDHSLTNPRRSSPTTSAAPSVLGSNNASSNSNGKQLLTSVTLLGVLYANCIGSGYGFEDSVGSAGPLVTLLFCLIVPWIWCFPTGLAVSELSTSVRSNSGVLMWVNVAFHPVVSFFCVLITVFITFVGNASYPTLAASYVERLVPLGPIGRAMVKLVCVGVCAALNISGVELVGNAAVGISIATLAPFLIFTAKQLLFTSGLDVQALLYVKENIDWTTFLAITSWSFANIENAGSVVEEVANPKKTMVGVMVPLMLLTYPAYFFPVAAGVSALGAGQDYSAWQSGYWAHVAEVTCGPIVKWMLLAGAIITSFGFTLTSLCCTSRSLEGMGTMDIFPSVIGRWLSQTSITNGKDGLGGRGQNATPVNAIMLNAVLTCVFCLLLDFESIVALCQALYCLRLLLIYAAVIKLRVDHPTLPRPYALPCGVFGCSMALLPPTIFSLAVTVCCANHSAFVKSATILFLGIGIALSYWYVTFYRPKGFRGQVIVVPRHARLAGESHGSSADDTPDFLHTDSSALLRKLEAENANSIVSTSVAAPTVTMVVSSSLDGNSVNLSQGAGKDGDAFAEDAVRLRRMRDRSTS